MQVLLIVSFCQPRTPPAEKRRGGAKELEAEVEAQPSVTSASVTGMASLKWLLIES